MLTKRAPVTGSTSSKLHFTLTLTDGKLCHWDRRNKLWVISFFRLGCGVGGWSEREGGGLMRVKLTKRTLPQCCGCGFRTALSRRYGGGQALTPSAFTPGMLYGAQLHTAQRPAPSVHPQHSKTDAIQLPRPSGIAQDQTLSNFKAAPSDHRLSRSNRSRDYQSTY